MDGLMGRAEEDYDSKACDFDPGKFLETTNITSVFVPKASDRDVIKRWGERGMRFVLLACNKVINSILLVNDRFE